MNTHGMAFLICRGLSLYALVLGAGPLANGLGMFLLNTGQQRYSSFEWPYTLRVSVLPAALYLAVSLLLWLGAPKLARAMASRDDAAPSGEGASGDWAALGVKLVGLLVLVMAVPQVANLSTNFALLQTMPDSMADFGPRLGASLIPAASETAVRLAVGAWLFFGAPNVARILRAARDVGRDEPLAP